MSHPTPAPASTKLSFTFDARYCSGCKACQVACKDKHNLEVGRMWRRVYEVSGGTWQQQGAAWSNEVFAYNLSIACNHCERPICVGVCPSGAMYQRPDGIVLVEQSKCLGCGYCAWACPYEAPQLDPQLRVMSKCTFCVDELALGKPPACVSACPLRVLDYRQDGYIPIHLPQAGLPDPSLTQPRLALTPHPGAQKGGQLANFEETTPARHNSEAPLAAFTLLAQAAAGLWIFTTLWGAILPGGRRTGLLPGMLLAVLLLLSGMFVSLAHLGQPGRAWRALARLHKSWLSREILFAGLSVTLWLAACASLWFAPVAGLFPWLMALGAASGIALVFAMARLYQLRTVPVWNTSHTTLSFFVAMLLCGAPLAAACITLNPGLSIGLRQEFVLPAGLFTLALALIELSSYRRWVTTWKLSGTRRMLQAHQGLLTASALFGGMVLLLSLEWGAAWLGQTWQTVPVLAGVLLIAAVLLALSGLLIHRWQFYQSKEQTSTRHRQQSAE